MDGQEAAAAAADAFHVSHPINPQPWSCARPSLPCTPTQIDLVLELDNGVRGCCVESGALEDGADETSHAFLRQWLVHPGWLCYAMRCDAMRCALRSLATLVEGKEKGMRAMQSANGKDETGPRHCAKEQDDC